MLLAAVVLDFLAIHPIADGNGRVARLLTTSEMLRLGYDVARYVSVEQRIFESKNAYYAAPRQSQERWGDGGHNVWPWTTYLVRVLAGAYDDFDQRVALRRASAPMTKQERVRHHGLHVGPAAFRLRDLRRALPGISDPTFRLALGGLRKEGRGGPSTGPDPGRSGPASASDLSATDAAQPEGQPTIWKARSR